MLILCSLPWASVVTHACMFRGVFKTNRTSPVAGRPTSTGWPGKCMGFQGSSVPLFLEGVVGAVGQNAVSHGIPLILHGSLTLVTVSHSQSGHFGSWGIKNHFRRPFVLSTIPLGCGYSRGCGTHTISLQLLPIPGLFLLWSDCHYLIALIFV